MARRAFPVRNVRGPQRSSLWIDLPAGVLSSSAVGGTIIASFSAGALLLRPFTIVRQYYEVLIRSDQSAAVETQIGAFGCCVVSEQASAIGVTAVPTPVTDAGSDLWMLHQWTMARENSLTDRTQPAGIYSLQSKAMRKVNEDEDFLIIQEFSSSGNGFDMFSAGRILLKLH